MIRRSRRQKVNRKDPPWITKRERTQLICGIYYYDLTFQNEGENVPEITFAPTTSISSAYPHSCIPPQSTRGSI